MSRIRRSLAALFLSQIATLGLSLLTVALVPKYLGPQSYGAFAAAAAYIAFFTLVATLGSQTYLLKILARDPSQLGRYTFNALLLKALLGALLATLAVFGAVILNYPGQTRRLIDVAAVGILLFALTDVLGAGLQATGRISSFALWAAAQRYVAGAASLGLLVTHHGVVLYTLAIAASGLVSLLAYGRQLWPDVRHYHEVDLRLWRETIAGGVPFFLWSAVLLVYGSIDILMLQRLTDTDTVGWYNLAYSWISIPVLFPAILVTAIFPTLSSTAVSDHSSFSDTANKALKLAVFIGTPMAIGISLTAPDIIRLFHYPASFSHSIPLMEILPLHIPIVAMDMILAIVLTARDRQKSWLLIGGIAAVFNPIANLLAIPLTRAAYGNGAIGASIVTVATELILMAGGILLRPAGVLDRHTLSFLGRTVMASLVIIPAVLAVRSGPTPVKVLVGAATFCICCFLLRLLSVSTCRSEAALLISSLRSRRQVETVPTGMESS